MIVYGLYGKSGTGKSHKAFKVIEDLSIDASIDDGILIVNKKKVVGKSAKNEHSLIAATKRAAFYSNSHRDEVADFLADSDFNSLLIIGTSKKMISKIAERLYLPIGNICWIPIENYQTAEELGRARRRRAKNYHVIPVYPQEIEKTFSGNWFRKLFIKLEKGKEAVLVVKPIYLEKDRVIISPQCIKDIVSIIAVDAIKIHKVKLDYEKVYLEVSTENDLMLDELLTWKSELVTAIKKTTGKSYTVDIKWQSVTSESNSLLHRLLSS